MESELSMNISSDILIFCCCLELGWGIVDCDKLGHLAYTPGQAAYNKVVGEFGQQIVSADGSINRQALGAIVFSDKSKLSALNNIVWPEIARF